VSVGFKLGVLSDTLYSLQTLETTGVSSPLDAFSPPSIHLIQAGAI